MYLNIKIKNQTTFSPSTFSNGTENFTQVKGVSHQISEGSDISSAHPAV